MGATAGAGAGAGVGVADPEPAADPAVGRAELADAELADAEPAEPGFVEPGDESPELLQAAKEKEQTSANAAEQVRFMPGRVAHAAGRHKRAPRRASGDVVGDADRCSSA